MSRYDNMSQTDVLGRLAARPGDPRMHHLMHPYTITINFIDRPLATFDVWDYNRHDAAMLARRAAEVLAALPLPSPTTEAAVVTVVRADAPAAAVAG